MQSSEENVLSNSAIVSTIIPYMTGKEFLRSRLVSKIWNTEILQAYPRKRNIYFKSCLYTKLHENGTAPPLPTGFPFLKRVSNWDNLNPQTFNLFCREKGQNIEMLYLSLNETPLDKSWSWESMFYTLLRENSLPNLVELRIKLSGSAAFQPPRRMATFTLSNLQKLKIEGRGSEKDKHFYDFAQSVINNSPSLIELSIRGEFFPKCTNKGYEIESLKYEGIIKPEKIPELEEVLQRVSPFLVELQLCLTLPKNCESKYLKLPKMPELKKYVGAISAPNPLPFRDGDFILYLEKKLPSLETMKVGGIKEEVFTFKTCNYIANVFAVSESEAIHQKMKVLQIPKPGKGFFPKIKERFPNLRGIYDVGRLLEREETRQLVDE